MFGLFYDYFLVHFCGAYWRKCYKKEYQLSTTFLANYLKLEEENQRLREKLGYPQDSAIDWVN